MVIDRETITDRPRFGDTYPITVNGVEIDVHEKEIAAVRILELAKDHGAIPGSPDEYILKGENREYQGGDLVDVATDKFFIAIPNTPTPVAYTEVSQ